MDKIIPVGFMTFDVEDRESFPEPEFFDRITLRQELMPMDCVPLVKRYSKSMEMFDDRYQEEIKHEAFVVAIIILRWLKEEKIAGSVTLWFQLRVQHMNVQLECAAVQMESK